MKLEIDASQSDQGAGDKFGMEGSRTIFTAFSAESTELDTSKSIGPPRSAKTHYGERSYWSECQLTEQQDH